MKNIGRINITMSLLDNWLYENIDEIYHLNNEDIYISAPGVRS